jgi:hypothetical protein
MTTKTHEPHHERDLEHKKLQLEIRKLDYETRWFARFSSLSWPILSSALTILIAYAVYTIQENEAEQKDREVFLEALQRATDSSESFDARVAGLWSVGQYWKEWPVNVANTLAAVLATGLDAPSAAQSESYDVVRQNAAEVMGEGISGTSTEKKPSKKTMAERALLLFGNGNTGECGSVTRIHWYLIGLRKNALKRNLPLTEINRKIQATKIAARRCLMYLEDAHFADFDLTGAPLQGADLERAVFKSSLLDRANLEGADLSYAYLLRTDLRCADLEGATLYKLRQWESATVTNANVHDVHGNDEFKLWALGHGALDMAHDRWEETTKSVCYLGALGLAYTE